MNITFTSTVVTLCWLCASCSFADSPIRPGDRIAIVGNTFADQLRVHGYLETLLLQHTCEDPVSVRHLGWGGDMLSARDRPTGFPSEDATLKAHKTDVIIACFGMGESFNGEKGLEDFENSLHAFITSHAGKIYNGTSPVRLILVSPIAYEDLGKLTPLREKRNRDLQAYTRTMSKVAEAMEVTFVNLFQPSRYLMDEPAGPSLTNNGIHLNSYGYWAMSRVFLEQLIAGGRTSDSRRWQLVIDASAKTGQSRGVEISQLMFDESGVSFQATEKSLPSPPPPTDQPMPPQLELNRDQLVVRNLEPGNYALTVDGQRVGKADDKAWADGLAIDSSPAHVAAEAYRAAVNDKNLQFTYSWKALNQVHIVGERKKSPSGQTLPQEVIEFNRLANERDRALHIGIELKTRTWRLTRVSN